VRGAFADLFAVQPEQLSVGLDCVFFRGAGAAAADANLEWLHVDQNHCTGLDWPCAQGALYVWPSAGEACSTTVVWPGSHVTAYERLMADPLAVERGRSPGGQSVKLRELRLLGTREELLREALAGSRRLPCPAGSLLLWDSRTVHQGWAGGPRLAQPVCWEPRKRRDQAALRRKLWMCAAGVPSSHSSTEGRVHGMATRERPVPSPASDGVPAARDTIAPYGVSPDGEARWLALQDALWRGSGNPRQNAGRLDPALLIPLLRQEVVDAL